MSKTLRITLKQSPEALIRHAKAAAAQRGVTLVGDIRAGSFSGVGVEGQYAVEGKVLSIAILKKPLIMPWSLIETTVMEFFACS